MACDLKQVFPNGDCPDCDGGILRTGIVDCDKVADMVFDTDGCLVGLVLTEADAVLIYEFDGDDTAFYNQTGSRPTPNKFTVTQQASFKFCGINKDSIAFANGIKGCCCLFAFHELDDCSVIGQGFEYLEGKDAGQNWRKTKQNLKATPSILSDTGANDNRIEILLDSVGSCFSPSAGAITLDDLALGI